MAPGKGRTVSGWGWGGDNRDRSSWRQPGSGWSWEKPGTTGTDWVGTQRAPGWERRGGEPGPRWGHGRAEAERKPSAVVSQQSSLIFAFPGSVTGAVSRYPVPAPAALSRAAVAAAMLLLRAMAGRRLPPLMQLPRGCSRLAAGSAAPEGHREATSGGHRGETPGGHRGATPGGHRGAAPVLAALLGLGVALAYGERRRRVSDTAGGGTGRGGDTSRSVPVPGTPGWGWIPAGGGTGGADPGER